MPTFFTYGELPSVHSLSVLESICKSRELMSPKNKQYEIQNLSSVNHFKHIAPDNSIFLTLKDSCEIIVVK